MSEIARLYRYKSLLSGMRAVSKAQLLQALEISEATLKRDLAKLRDQLNIPIEYDRDAGGYRIVQGHTNVELPGLWFSPEELASLVTVQHMLGQLEPGLLGPRLKPLQQRLSSLMQSHGLEADQVARKIRVVHAGKRTPAMECFEAVAMATLGGVQIQITHFNRQSGNSVQRTVSPLRLVHYRDNWYLDAWCHLRGGVRSFSVDAITRAEITQEPVVEVDEDQLRAILQSSYGIFTGAPKDWAVLRFSPLRSRWVQQEQWHPSQITRVLPNGSVELEIPYSDDRELLADVLRHGADVEVLRPRELRRKVADVLAAAAGQYAATPKIG